MTKTHLLTFLCCCGLLSCSLGLGVNSYGVFITPVCTALGVGRAAIALHVTLSGLSVAFLCPFIVRLLKTGPFNLILGTCVLLNSSAYFLMAFADRVWMFNLLGILRGVGSAGFYTATATILLGNWFQKHLGTLTGILVSFSGIAGALLSPLLTSIITNHGYKAAYLFCAAFVLVLSLPTPLLISLHPEKKGLQPYGAGSQQASAAAATPARMVNQLRYSSPLCLLILLFAFTTAFEVGITSHLSGYAQSIGMGATMGATMMSACMVGNILFKALYGVMSDHMPPMLVSAIMLSANAGGIALILLSRSSVGLLLGGFLFGGIYSITTVGLSALVRGQYGNKQYGDLFSLGTSMGSLANAISITTIGAAFDLTGSFTAPLVIGVLLGLFNLALLAYICRLGEKNRCIVE